MRKEVCRACGQTGHWARECPNGRNGPTYGTNRPAGERRPVQPHKVRGANSHQHDGWGTQAEPAASFPPPPPHNPFALRQRTEGTSSELPLLTLKPRDEPRLTLTIEGREILFLVDTGATKSAIRKIDFPNAPLSHEQVKVVGVSCVAMVIPLSEQLRVEIGPLLAQHAFLMATDTPINLLGRDLLC